MATHAHERHGDPGTISVGPVIASPGEPAASASRPDVELEVGRYDTYQANPVPWWISLLWVSFFLFGVIYLVANLVMG
jgi:hypothetical protein